MSEPAAAPAATLEPEPGYTPFVTDAMRLVRVLISPTEVFTELNARPRFWTPWLIISVLYTVTQFLQRPFQQRIGEIFAERAGRPVPTPSAVGQLAGLVTGPLFVLILVAIAAGILYLLCSSLGGESTFKKMLVVSIHGWPLVILTQLVTWIVLTMRGVSAIQGPSDLFVSLGLDLLLPADTTIGYFPRFMMAGIGPIQIWQLVISAVGLTVMGKMSKGGAWAAAIILFVLLLVGFSALGAFGMKMMGG